MSERITPTFSGEVQLAGWSESHNGGCKVTFWLQDSSDLEAFRTLTVRKGNTAGHRMMAALVEIGEDEQPVPPAKEKRMGPYCYQAVKWCADRDFQKWVARCSQQPLDSVGAQEAKQFILKMCGIKSRKDLDGSEEAQRMWHANIVGPYRKSRIARGLE